MKNTLTLVAAFTVTFCAFAQKDKGTPKFGVVTSDEFKMQNYSRDTAANSVILFDIGSCSLEDDLAVTFKRHIRIKFFGTEDIDEYASKTVYFETVGESITRVKGSTYNMENGQMVESKLDDDGIFKGKVDKVYSSVKFTMPNVKPGSIVEYSYMWSMNASLLPSWQFQHTIPTIYSEYETIIPKTFSFRKDMQGFLSLFDVITKNEGSYERLIMKDAPAFKIEPFLTTPDDYVSTVHYYITSIFVPGKFFNFERSWPGIAKSYDESQDFGLLLRTNAWLDRTIEPLLAGATTPEEKSKRIHDYVKTNIAWNEVIDKFPDHTLKKVLDDKKGSTSEINMLMIAMMRRADLDAYPVLISTRDHGIVRPFTPHAGQFNDVICLVKIDGKDKLFDGTNKTLPYNSLPERCMNGQGLLVSRDKSDWVALVSAKSRIVYQGDFKLKQDGELEGKLTIARDGLDGGNMRSSFASLGKEKYLSESFARKSWEFSKSEFQNIEGIANMPQEVHEIVIRDHAQANGDVIYISPYVIGLEENKFKSEIREYPVHIPTAFERFYTVKLEIPAGYKVEELPANKLYVLPEGGGKFVYSTTVIGNVINFMSQLSITKNTITPDLYPNLREFYSMVVAKQAEQIVLKKTQ